MKKEIKYDSKYIEIYLRFNYWFVEGPWGAEQALIAKYIQNKIFRQVG